MVNAVKLEVRRCDRVATAATVSTLHQVMMRVTDARTEGLDLNLLTVFAAIRAEGSITRAAARIGLTQAGASRALARLRTRFEDPLFARGRAGLVLTPRGAELAQAATEILAIVEQHVLPVQLFDPRVHQRRFRIVIADYAELLVVTSTLALLPEQAPRVEIETLPSLASDASAGFRRDRSRGRTRIRAGGGPARRRLMTDRLVVSGAAASSAMRRQLTLKTLRRARTHVALARGETAAPSRRSAPAALLAARSPSAARCAGHARVAQRSDLAATVPPKFAKARHATEALQSFRPVASTELRAVFDLHEPLTEISRTAGCATRSTHRTAGSAPVHRSRTVARAVPLK